MAILYFHWHVVVKNGNFTLLLTCSGQEWHFCHEIDRKTFIFWVNLGMWHLKSIVLEKMSTVLRVSTHIYGVSKEIDGKTWIFQLNLGMWPLKSIVLEKTSTVLRVSTHIYGVSKDVGGKTWIFQLNLGMWPLKSIVLEKWALFWGFQHTFMGFLRR